MLAHEMCLNVLIGYCIKQIDSILPWVCTLIINAQRELKRGGNISHTTRLRFVAYFFVLTTF